MALFSSYESDAVDAVVAAQREARRHGAREISPEHLLLGLFQRRGAEIVCEPSVAEVLHSVRADPRALRAAVEALLTDSAETPTDSGETPSSGNLLIAPRTKKILAGTQELAARRGSASIKASHLLLSLACQDDDPVSAVVRRFGVVCDQS